MLLGLLLLGALSMLIGVEEMDWSILLYSRIPRTLTVVITGFGISLSGLIFQHISRNKFVSPSTSGAISGAQLGIALSIVLFKESTTFEKMIMAFIVSLLTTGIFMYLLNKIRFKEIIFIPLLGLMLGAVIRSITTLIAYRFNFLQLMEGWFYGSFSLIIAGRYEMIFIILPGIILALIYAKAFSIVGMGKEFSINLGINYKSVVNIGLVIIAIINASSSIVVGTIPFLGLVVPNICSIYLGDNLKKNIFWVGLAGSIFLLVCDIVSRIIHYPYELPVGLIVGVVGCGIFLYLILIRRSNG